MEMNKKAMNEQMKAMEVNKTKTIIQTPKMYCNHAG